MGGLIWEGLEWGGPDMGGLIWYGAYIGGPGVVRNVPNPAPTKELKALNRLPVGCLRGTLFVTKVLAGFFVSSESVSYTLMGPVESSRT